MSRSNTGALAVPSVLRWARENSGLTSREVARRLDVGEETLGRWETGKEKPSVSELETLAHVYKRPLALFFLPGPPDDEPLPRDFRMLPEGRSGFSPQSRLAIRRARRVQAVVAELARNLDKPFALGLERLKLSGDPEAAAASTRRALGIDIETQASWKTESEALRNWRNAVEQHGVLVLQASVPVTELRGFSLADRMPPVVVLNGRDAITARTFSLFHELAHVLLALPGICTIESAPNDEAKGYDARVEVYCNGFAGALLVPRTALEARVDPKRRRKEWSDVDLRELAGSFKVSTQVILRRLVTIGFATEDFYRRRHKAWRTRAPSAKRRGFGVAPADQCIRNTGVTAVSMVMEARRRGAITQRDVADYLGLRTEHLPKVERLLRGHGRA